MSANNASGLGSAIGAKLGEILDDTLQKANEQSAGGSQMGGLVDSILDRLDGDNDDPTRRLEVIGANVGAKIGEMFGLGGAEGASGDLADAQPIETAQNTSGGGLLGDLAGSLIKNIADKNGDGKVDMGEIAQTLMENFSGKKA